MSARASIPALFAAAVPVLMASCTNDTDDTCSVIEDTNGTIHVGCPNGTTDITPCYASLPDLDGNGAMEEADCGLADAGEVQRAVCDDERTWWSQRACRAMVGSGAIINFNNFNVNRSVTIPSSGGLRHVYVAVGGTSPQLRVWRDANDDGRFESSEDSLVAAVDSIELVERVGQTVVASSQSSTDVVMWSDINDDGIPDESEVASHSILPAPQPGTIAGTVQAFQALGRVALAYQEGGSSSSVIRGWSDIDDDGIFEESETIEIAYPFTGWSPDLPAARGGSTWGSRRDLTYG